MRTGRAADAIGALSCPALEARPRNSSPFICKPRGFGRTLTNPKLTWYYPTGPEPEHADAGSPLWVRGRTLGGSSAVNGMIYVRGQPEDYDEWAAATLKAAGVTGLHDLPGVGGNLREHKLLTLQYRLHRWMGDNRELSGWQLARNLALYGLARRGPLAPGRRRDAV